jgi:dipeptidyl aminopeptidase/acylaminoacyl peptidase
VTVYGGGDLAAAQARYGGADVSTIAAPVFTTRGYAVLLVDAPLGPAGKPGWPAAELREGVLPQVYQAAELGYIDRKRLALTGQSYGGYSTAALVAQTNATWTTHPTIGPTASGRLCCSSTAGTTTSARPRRPRSCSTP